MSKRTVCAENQCCGCMACVDVCTKHAIRIVDNMESYNAVIDADQCVNCNACVKVCQRKKQVTAVKPIKWYQGWCENETIRRNGSSGGIAGALSTRFISEGGVVCSCVFRDGAFRFEFAEHEDELAKFAGSKYVKSNPSGIYKEIRRRLSNHQKVLFIGLPCQVAALKGWVGDESADLLYTVDLICHGAPSPKLLDLFLGQYGKSLRNLKNIEFRKKGKYQVYEKNEGIITTGVTDRYLIAFLNSLTYTQNCYQCPYAKLARVSDITLGDSWGTNLPEAEMKRGISLLLAQTEKGAALLEQAQLHLEPVDLENAVAHNHQLRIPSIMPAGRSMFFERVSKGENFNKSVLRCLPKQCLKQNLKCVLIKTGVFKLIRRH